MAIWRYTTAAPDLSGIATTADVAALAASANATAAQLATFIAQQNAGTSNGTSYSYAWTSDQDRTDNFNPGLGDYIRFDNVNAMRFTKSFQPNTTFYAHEVTKQPLVTDSQSVVGIVEGKLNKNTSIGLVLGAKADMSEFMLATFFQDSVYLLKCTYNTATGAYAFGGVATATGLNIPDNAVVEVRRVVGALTTNYVLLANNSTVLPYSDATNAYVGAAYRNVGWLQGQVNSIIFQNNSPAISAWVASDIAVPTVLGTGWEIYRASATPKAGQNGEGMLTASQPFDNLKRSINVTIASLSVGQINITKAGWYTVCLRVHTSSAAGTGVYVAILYTNLDTTGNVNGATMRKDKVGQDVTGTQVPSTFATWVLYCPVGTVLIPGVNFSGGARSVIGDSAGVLTYFSGSLTSIGG